MGGNNYSGYFPIKAYMSESRAEEVVSKMSEWSKTRPTLPRSFCDEDVTEFLEKETAWTLLCPYPELLSMGTYDDYILGKLQCE